MYWYIKSGCRILKGGYYKFEKKIEGNVGRPKIDKDRLQTKNQSKAAGKRKKEQDAKKLSAQTEMKMNDLEKENIHLKRERQTDRDDIQVLNKKKY